MNLNDKFYFMTTLVLSSTPAGQSQGTGFFYQHLAPTEKEGPQWRKILNTWLVTNRHVVLPRIGDQEVVPSSFSFHLRRVDGEKPEWEPVALTESELRKRTRLHPNPEVDLAMVEVKDLLTEKASQGGIAQWHAVQPENFAGPKSVEVEASSDVLVIGYPRGFYDRMNLYPIVKSGIVASRWGAHFNGQPYFLIDAKLFPGSSGSIVVSKPIDIKVKEGQVYAAPEKVFAFLGIFSGEPFRRERPIELDDMIIIEKSGYNVGVVWYADPLIEQIVNDGVAIPDE